MPWTNSRAERNSVCLVTANDRLAGIFTERDILRKVVDTPSRLDAPVDEIMTSEPITVGPEASTATALQLMNDHHIRNLPVVSGNGTIIGNMTHQSIINYLAARYPIEVLNLPPDLERFPRKPEGG